MQSLHISRACSFPAPAYRPVIPPTKWAPPPIGARGTLLNWVAHPLGFGFFSEAWFLTRGGSQGGVARVRRGRGHLVVEADDGEAEERNGVFGAEDALVVRVDVEELVECLDVANAPVVRAGA